MASLVAQMVKESACNSRDLGSIAGSGRAPGGRHGNPLQYSCLENPIDRGAWQTIVHGLQELDMTWQLNHQSIPSKHHHGNMKEKS